MPDESISQFLSDHPALWISPRKADVGTLDTDIEEVSHADAIHLLTNRPCILLNAPLTARRLKQTSVPCLDILELFAFVRPARAIVPTIGGLRYHFNLDIDCEIRVLQQAASILLGEVINPNWPQRKGAFAALQFLRNADWHWSDIILSLMPQPKKESGLWGFIRQLPEWHEKGNVGRPDDTSFDLNETQLTLKDALGPNAEHREGQIEMTNAVHDNLQPNPQLMASMVEAGTGIGKTLAYLAPLKVWAEQSGGVGWISTYTKNLQHQMKDELARVYPDEAERKKKTLIRKGRENYTCLLNLENMMEIRDSRSAIMLGLIFRWLMHTKDGDMTGGDLPGWFASVFGARAVLAMTDRRGECIYSACQNYTRCFVERSRRAGADTKLIVGNHALTLTEALTRNDRDASFDYMVFDEGHHLFDAADSAFSIHLTGLEGSELRRWLLGGEGRKRTRATGLRARFGSLAELDVIRDGIDSVERAARILPKPGWLKRLQMNDPQGSYEAFLAIIRMHVFKENPNAGRLYAIEAKTDGLINNAEQIAEELCIGLSALADPILALAKALQDYLSEQDEYLSKSDRNRIESYINSLRLRADLISTGWLPMLRALDTSSDDRFVDWCQIDRVEGSELDIGLHRHFLDPTKPLANHVYEPAKSITVTSATLRDRLDSDDEADNETWEAADIRTGLQHLVQPAKRYSIKSPFNYAANTKVIIVNDIPRTADHLADAMRMLIMASKGRALGLFTAVAMLRDVYHRIVGPLDDLKLPLYAQHIDPMDTGTLVDIFRHEDAASLFGTDALRDGVDVPGDSLSMVMFDKVPWPRPTIIHKARRDAFGSRKYDEMIVRLRLKQAFGRLVRKNDDRGVFLILDAATPSRLLTAFPKGVAIERIGLRDAIEVVRDFL